MDYSREEKCRFYKLRIYKIKQENEEEHIKLQRRYFYEIAPYLLSLDQRKYFE